MVVAFFGSSRMVRNEVCRQAVGDRGILLLLLGSLRGEQRLRRVKNLPLRLLPLQGSGGKAYL